MNSRFSRIPFDSRTANYYIISLALPSARSTAQASNDASLLYHKLFSLYVNDSTSLLFIQSIIIALCLPRVLVPSILPSRTVHRRISLFNTWSNQCFCLCCMVFIKLLFSSTISKTSWLDRCSVQLIFINLLQVHISNDSSRRMSTFLNVHASVTYNIVLQIRVFTILLTLSFLSVILLVYRMLLVQWLFDVSLPHDIYSLLWLHFLNT